MEDEQLIHELEQVATQTGEQPHEHYLFLIKQVIQQSYEYQSKNLHWLAIALLSRASKVIYPFTNLNRNLALALGGKAELLLKWSDMLRVAPTTEMLSMAEDDLQQAINIDPTLADPFWDLAVINARFRGNYEGATTFLKKAIALGYNHPMISSLIKLIQDQPLLQQVPDSSETSLRLLLLKLALQAAGPMESALDSEEESKEMGDLQDGQPEPLRLRTFGDYVREAKVLVVKHDLTINQFSQILQDIKRITSNSAEYLADLLHRMAETEGDMTFLQEAMQWHLSLILKMAFYDVENRKNDPAWLRRSIKIARRGLKIIKQSSLPVDPDIHAEFLIAEGQALYYVDEHHTIEAVECYWEALKMKRKVGKTEDIERLKEILWRQIDHRRGLATVSFHFGGVGQALEILKVCSVVANNLEDLPRAMALDVDLASVMRQAGQFYEAEEILQKIIDLSPPDDILHEAQFEIASVYSETSRHKKAAKLQWQLLMDWAMPDNRKKAVLWSNYANSLSLSGDVEGARTALQKAWEVLPETKKQKVKGTVQLESVRIKMLFAELEVKTGNYIEALNYVHEAEELHPATFGLNGMYFHKIKAQCLISLKRFDEAVDSLDGVINNFRFLLNQGPSLQSWESLLAQWSHIDASMIRCLVGSGRDDRYEQAMLRAECAKGRIFAWLEFGAKPEMAQYALSLERQIEALTEVKKWLGEKPKRRILSLFGSKDGLGIFEIDEKGKVSGGWLDNFDYDLLNDDIYTPWESNLEYALNEGHPGALALEGSLMNHMLDLVGTWLWQVNPSLMDGGSDLVILPHRLFRRLPLAHARLPQGARLSDLFDTVVVNPSLASLARGIKSSVNKKAPARVTALANADIARPLPFAGCEAILSGAGENTMLGSAVTSDALSKAFGHDGTLLLSLHGDFNESNPFESKIFTADGHFPLQQLLLQQTPVESSIIILGICEAGRSRRSLSDEPIGFPAMLLELNVQAVLAPAWQVDDFASFLYLSRLFDTSNNSMDIFQRAGVTARWLRELKADEVLKLISHLISKIMEFGETGKTVAAEVKPALEKQKTWLETLNLDDKPFRSPLDWAAFQITGIPN